MYVGVIPAQLLQILSSIRIPHVRGGDPVRRIGVLMHFVYSPCTWG